MTKKEKKYYMELLLKEKNRILRTIGHLKEDALGEKKQEFSGVPNHIADLGTDEFSRDLEISLSDSEGKILKLINEAIEKLEKGTYGKCERCGKNISKTRLTAIPYAKYCIKCQKEIEEKGEEKL
ncbi:MAG TPA: hypothetical protein ENG68_00630 [bacterium]|nr:hypothetical protein [bacterium]